MGTTGIHKSHGNRQRCMEAATDLVGERLVKGAWRGNHYYYAARYIDGSVYGGVVMASQDREWWYFKEVDETMGPYAAKCPKTILEALTEPANEYAKTWRERCWAEIDAMPRVGDTVAFSPGYVVNGEVICRFKYLGKNRWQSPSGSIHRLRGWRGNIHTNMSKDAEKEAA